MATLRFRSSTTRRISFEESLDFERVHEVTYLELDDDPIGVPGEIAGRASIVEAWLDNGYRA